MSLDKNELTESLDRAIGEQLELNTFVEVALTGMHDAAQGTRLIELTQKTLEAIKRPSLFTSDEELREHVDKAKKLENFARSQATSGFPYLFSLAIIRCWSIIEVAVDDLVLALLARPDHIPPDGILSEIKGPLLPFLNASLDERAELMAIALKQKLATALKPGAARFEELLGPFGLAGTIDDSVKRLLFELSAVRNVLVHKNGVADKRFVEACPWINCKQGVKISPSYSHFHMYLFASGWYVNEVSLRTRRKFQLEEDQNVIALQPTLLDTCQTLLSNRDRFLAQGT
jgi:hypothetical protein